MGEYAAVYVLYIIMRLLVFAVSFYLLFNCRTPNSDPQIVGTIELTSNYNPAVDDALFYAKYALLPSYIFNTVPSADPIYEPACAVNKLSQYYLVTNWLFFVMLAVDPVL